MYLNWYFWMSPIIFYRNTLLLLIELKWFCIRGMALLSLTATHKSITEAREQDGENRSLHLNHSSSKRWLKIAQTVHNECLEKTKGKAAKTARATDRERESSRENKTKPGNMWHFTRTLTISHVSWCHRTEYIMCIIIIRSDRPTHKRVSGEFYLAASGSSAALWCIIIHLPGFTELI